MADKQPIEAKGPYPDEIIKGYAPGDVGVPPLTLEEDKRILRRIDL
jgi:hypothetical protein